MLQFQQLGNTFSCHHCCYCTLHYRWSKACARNAAASPYGDLPSWGLRGVIIKSGDDCRQELLALQLIRELQDIWTGEAHGL